MSKAQRGKIVSRETRLKQSISMRGKTWFLSEETKLKMSKAQRGKIVSRETRLKLSNTMKNQSKITCPHCKKEGIGVVMRRWHFDNCKVNNPQ